MHNRSKILILISAFLPGYKSGGPVPSIAHLVGHLGDEFAFSILTADRDMEDSEPYPGLPSDRWIDAYGARIRYASPQEFSPLRLAATIRATPHDLLYINSFFDARSSVMPLVARRFGLLPAVPTLLAPRGQFSAGAVALKSTKKRAYMRGGRALGLFRDLHWHASTEYEAADIRAVMDISPDRIGVASDLVAPLPDAPPPHRPRAPGTPLRVLFLSRISPKKNLDFALKALAGIGVSIDLTVAGPQEDAAYVARCRDLAHSLPAHVKVRWVGPIAPENVPEMMAAHDLFFLPTMGENFGHVIAEALGAGTPVLLSDTTPWRGLSAHGVGDDLPLDRPERFQEAIEAAWRRDVREAARMRQSAAAFARHRQRDGGDVQANRILFHSVLAGALP